MPAVCHAPVFSPYAMHFFLEIPLTFFSTPVHLSPALQLPISHFRCFRRFRRYTAFDAFAFFHNTEGNRCFAVLPCFVDYIWTAVLALSFFFSLSLWDGLKSI